MLLIYQRPPTTTAYLSKIKSIVKENRYRHLVRLYDQSVIRKIEKDVPIKINPIIYWDKEKKDFSLSTGVRIWKSLTINADFYYERYGQKYIEIYYPISERIYFILVNLGYKVIAFSLHHNPMKLKNKNQFLIFPKLYLTPQNRYSLTKTNPKDILISQPYYAPTTYLAYKYRYAPYIYNKLIKRLSQLLKETNANKKIWKKYKK